MPWKQLLIILPKFDKMLPARQSVKKQTWTWQNVTSPKFSYSWHFKNVVCLFCAVNITKDIKNFVQISTLLNKTETVEIWTKFSGNIESRKNADHMLRFCDYNSRIILLKLGLRINAANYFKDQRRRLNPWKRIMSGTVAPV